jgi:hypothetical protein
VLQSAGCTSGVEDDERWGIAGATADDPEDSEIVSPTSTTPLCVGLGVLEDAAGLGVLVDAAELGVLVDAGLDAVNKLKQQINNQT